MGFKELRSLVQQLCVFTSSHRKMQDYINLSGSAGLKSSLILWLAWVSIPSRFAAVASLG